MSNLSPIELTPASLALFLELAKDAGNWSGMPPLDCNVKTTKEHRGNLTHLKKAGLICTQVDEGLTWVIFEDAGRLLAHQHGIRLGDGRDDEFPGAPSRKA